MAASITVYGVKIGTRLAEIQADYAGTVQVLTGKLLADTLATLDDDSVGIMLDVDQYPAGVGSGVIKNGFDYLAQRINDESQLFVSATGDKVFHVSMVNFNQGSYAVRYPAVVSADKDTAMYDDVLVSGDAAALFATGITAQTTGIAYETVSDLITYLMNVIKAP